MMLLSCLHQQRWQHSHGTAQALPFERTSCRLVRLGVGAPVQSKTLFYSHPLLHALQSKDFSLSPSARTAQSWQQGLCFPQ